MKYILILIFISAAFTSCIVTSDTAIIEDFSEPVVLNLNLNGNMHTSKAMQLKGEVDDSVYIKLCSICYKDYLSGKIDTTFRMDFAGRDSTLFYFYPYKAKSGKLKLTYSAL